MSFVSERQATTFDTEVAAFWSQLIQRDATSPLFFLPLKLGGLGVGSALLRSAMRLPHGELGDRSFHNSWQPRSPPTQTLSSLLHHNSTLNLFNHKPLSHNR